MPDSSVGSVVELTPWEMTVRGAVRRREAVALLERPDADQAIKDLSELEAYYAVKSIGVEEAGPLLLVMEPDQVRALVDLDIWRQDRPDLSDLLVWLSAFRELSSERLAMAAKALDPELLAMLLRRRLFIAITPKEEDEDTAPAWLQSPPDEILPLVHTADRRFIIAARTVDEVDELDGLAEPLDEEERKAILELVDLLYREEDGELIAAGLRLAHDDFLTDLEESAHRFRDARMEDLGFPPRERAFSVYAQVDPERVLAEQATRATPSELRLPAVHAQRLSVGLLRAALNAVEDPTLVRAIEAELVPLSNAVLVADGINPGDLEGLASVLERLRATLELALAWGGEGDPVEVALARLRRLPLRTLFAAGWSITLRLSQRARVIRSHSVLKGQATAFLGERDRAVLDALTRSRPLFPTLLDGSTPSGEAPIARPEQVVALEGSLAELEGALAAASAFGVRAAQEALLGSELSPPAPERCLDLYLTTVAARALLGQAPAVRPLTSSDLSQLKEALVAGQFAEGRLRTALDRLALDGLPPSARGRVARHLGDLAEDLAPLVQSGGRPDLRYIRGVLLELS